MDRDLTLCGLAIPMPASVFVVSSRLAPVSEWFAIEMSLDAVLLSPLRKAFAMSFALSFFFFFFMASRT